MMRTLTLFLVLLVGSAQAATLTNMTVKAVDFSTRNLANRYVTITPTDENYNDGALVSAERRKQRLDANGETTFTNVVLGYYFLDLASTPRSRWNLYVDTATNSLNVTNFITSVAGNNGIGEAWTKAQADTRFVRTDYTNHGDNVWFDASGLSGNLSPATSNLLQLAQAVDGLTLGSGSALTNLYEDASHVYSSNNIVAGGQFVGNGGGLTNLIWIDAVREYGADNTGATDTADDIQAALQAAHDAGGGTVFLRRGTYAIGPTTVSGSDLELSECILFFDSFTNVFLVGEGIGATTLMPNADLGENIIGATNSSYIGLFEMTIDCADSSDIHDVTQFHDSQFIWFEKLHIISDTTGDGEALDTDDSFFVFAKECILDCQSGNVSFGNVSSPIGGYYYLSDCVFINGDDATQGDPPDRVSVKVQGAEGTQIIFQRCTWTNVSKALNFKGTDGFIVDSGFDLSATASITNIYHVAGKLVFRGCEFAGSGTAGRMIVSGTRLTVEDSIFAGITYTNIWITGGLEARISNNRFTYSSTRCINVDGGTNLFIGNNLFVGGGSPSKAMNFTGAGNLRGTKIVGNICASGGEVNFNGNADALTISDNVWVGNWWFSNVDYSRISDNWWSSGTITIVSGSQTNVFSDNWFQGVTLSTSTANYFKDNVIEGTLSDGSGYAPNSVWIGTTDETGTPIAVPNNINLGSTGVLTNVADAEIEGDLTVGTALGSETLYIEPQSDYYADIQSGAADNDYAAGLRLNVRGASGADSVAVQYAGNKDATFYGDATFQGELDANSMFVGAGDEFSVDATGDVSMSAGNLTLDTGTATFGGAAHFGGILNAYTGNLVFARAGGLKFQIVSDGFEPYYDAAYDLGDPANQFKDGYFSGTITAATLDITGDATIGGDVTITNSLTVEGPVGKTDSGSTLGAAATTFAITTDFAVMTGDGGGNTVATITGGATGQRLTLLFTDGNITITDTDAHTANTVDLSAAFTSADDTTLTLIFDGTSWYEISRSVN